MREFSIGLLAAIGCGLLLVALLERSGSRFVQPVRTALGLVTRLGLAVIFGWTAVRAAQAGGVLDVGLAVLLGLLALFSALLAGLMVWAAIHERRGAVSG